MPNKINLAILFGGRSCEHEVSVTSAKSIVKEIKQDKYNVSVIGIDKQGYWHIGDSVESITDQGSVITAQNSQAAIDLVSLELHHNGNLSASCSTIDIPTLDVVFPVLHGTFGEDGTMQGIFEIADIPYVGCGVAASAVAMDKALAKQIFTAVNIPQAPYVVLHHHAWQKNQQGAIETIEIELDYPVFVKPANLGSSVGVGKARDDQSLVYKIQHAFEFDNKIVIEQSMENCHEIECSVLGNYEVTASIPGEIIPGAEFYNYETKYIDDKSQLVIPAPLDKLTTRRVREMAIDSFLAIDGKGMARIDFFVNRDTKEVTLNEINTIPGFTPISMYPQLWESSGVPYAELIDRLIKLALENHRSKQRLKRNI